MIDDAPAAARDECETSPPREPSNRVLVQIQPARGEEVVQWLERASALGATGAISLVSFDAERAILAVDREALSRLGEVLDGTTAALPESAFLSAPDIRPLTDTPLSSGAEDERGEAGERPRRSRLRFLWLAGLTIALCALAGSIPALCIARRGELPGVSFLRGDLTTERPNATAAGQPVGPRSADRIRRVERSFEGDCLPEPGDAACSQLRASLWQGDADAWRQWAVALGEVPPAPADIARRTIELRLAAGDPAARAAVARGAGLPLPLIGTLTVREGGSGLSRIAGAEIVNAGSAAADLSGVRLEGMGALADRFILQPGQRCGLGTFAVGPACPLVQPQATTTGPVGDVLRLLADDGRVLDTLRIPR